MNQYPSIFVLEVSILYSVVN